MNHLELENPWLEIPYRDYENHMAEVGQAQVLNALTKYYLNKYRPVNFALLGCATGNGLKHVDPKITKKVFAIDINPEYLERTKERFEAHIDHLEILNIDIRKDELPFHNIDLLFAALVLEYVEPQNALRKIIATLNKKGILLIIIQKNKQRSFVTKTTYSSLEKLATISKEVDEKALANILHSEKMDPVGRDEIELPGDKSFIVLEYKKTPRSE